MEDGSARPDCFGRSASRGFELQRARSSEFVCLLDLVLPVGCCERVDQHIQSCLGIEDYVLQHKTKSACHSSHSAGIKKLLPVTENSRNGVRVLPEVQHEIVRRFVSFEFQRFKC